MPVYGPMVIGDEAFAHEAHIEQVMGNNVYGPLVVGELQPRKVAADAPAAPAAPATPELSLEQEMAQMQQAGAAERMAALLGESYTVSEAEQGLVAHPEIWFDLALAEMARATTAGARKGLVKSLLAAEPREGDEAIRTQLSALL